MRAMLYRGPSGFGSHFATDPTEVVVTNTGCEVRIRKVRSIHALPSVTT